MSSPLSRTAISPESVVTGMTTFHHRTGASEVWKVLRASRLRFVWPMAGRTPRPVSRTNLCARAGPSVVARTTTLGLHSGPPKSAPASNAFAAILSMMNWAKRGCMFVTLTQTGRFQRARRVPRGACRHPAGKRAPLPPIEVPRQEPDLTAWQAPPPPRQTALRSPPAPIEQTSLVR